MLSETGCSRRPVGGSPVQRGRGNRVNRGQVPVIKHAQRRRFRLDLLELMVALRSRSKGVTPRKAASADAGHRSVIRALGLSARANWYAGQTPTQPVP
jgi:hypothetical protein